MRRKPTARDPHYRSPEYLDLVGRLAANVRRVRSARGWTQEEAAAQCGGLSVYVLRQIESGSTNPTGVTLARLSAGLEIDVGLLLAPASAPEKRPPGRPATHPQAKRFPWMTDELIALQEEAAARWTAAAEELAQQERTAAQLDGTTGLPVGFMGAAPTSSAGSIAPVVAPPPSAAFSIASAPRLVPTQVVVPPYPAARSKTFSLPELRDFLATVLAANPKGLTAGELLQAARSAGQAQLPANNLHYALHYLVSGGHVERTGNRGSYVHRWIGGHEAG